MIKPAWSTSVGVILMIAVVPACDSRLLDNLQLIFSEKLVTVATPRPYHPSYIKKHPDAETPEENPDHGQNADGYGQSVKYYNDNKKNGSKGKPDYPYVETIKKKIKDFLKNTFGWTNTNKNKKKTENGFLESANYLLAGRKGHTGRDRTALIILLPQNRKQPKAKQLLFGHTQIRPSQDIRYSNSYPLSQTNLRENNEEKQKGVYQMIKRRSSMRPGDVILGAPTRPEHLPQALPILPGHTLLRPARGMLKSSVKYPLKDFEGTAVYGNLDNLGITLGKSSNRIQYTDFRKANSILLEKIQNAIQSSDNGKGRTHPLIVFEIDPSEVEAIKSGHQIHHTEDDNANEVFDDLDSLFVKDNSEPKDLRRKSKKKSLFRNRGKYYKRSKSSRESKSDDSSDDSPEKNDGNPLTIFKNKYKQNWLWNQEFDGDHMNVNPYAPQFNQLGPTAAELYHGRKWWYFNQDDYKPMGRKK